MIFQFILLKRIIENDTQFPKEGFAGFDIDGLTRRSLIFKDFEGREAGVEFLFDISMAI